MKFVYLIAISTILSTSAWANSNVKCGKYTNFDDFEVKGFELELSSDSDDYSGIVGKKWHLKLESENSEWLKVNKNITARNYKKDGLTIVQITIKTGKSVEGQIGINYKLVGLYEEEPTLEKYRIEGSSNYVKIGTYKCISAID